MAIIDGDVPSAIDTLTVEVNKLRADVAALQAWASTHQHSALNANPTAAPAALTSAPLSHSSRGSTR